METFSLEELKKYDGTNGISYIAYRGKVYDVTGRRVISVPLGTVGAGQHTIQWNGRDAGGLRMTSGTYFVRLRGDTQESGAARVIVLR